MTLANGNNKDRPEEFLEQPGQSHGHIDGHQVIAHSHDRVSNHSNTIHENMSPALRENDVEEEVFGDSNEQYNEIRHYNLRPSVVPPYVLDSVAKAHYSKESDNNEMDLSTANYNYNNIAGSNTRGVSNDLFLSSINNNWNSFLNTIESKSSNLLKNKVIPLAHTHSHHEGDKQQHRQQIQQQLPAGKEPTSPEPQYYSDKKLLSSSSHSHYDDTTLEEYKLPDLSGSWEGDERLKKILNEETHNFNGNSDGLTNVRFFNFFRKSKPAEDRQMDSNMLQFSSSSRLANYQKHLYESKDYSPKIRSSAKYWMSTEQRGRWKPALKQVLLFSPYLLVTLRTIMFILSVIALGLAISIFRDTKSSGIYNISQQPSTIMAIAVQSVALVYLVYITWDEYSGKPVGLRNPMGKIKLILLDMFFIIFSSANLSLAYNTLYDDRWVCVGNNLSLLETTHGGLTKREEMLTLVARALNHFSSVKILSICEKQRALSAFLFITLCMWVFTFSISIFRVVERVSSPKS